MTERLCFFDTHVHFDDGEGEYVPVAVVGRAVEAGVGRMIAIGGSPEANRVAVETARAFPGNVWAAVGYDRYQAGADCPLAELKALLGDSDTVVAVGEAGLDFHYQSENRESQEELFEQMLVLARERCLPIIVHSREADVETVTALRKHSGAWRGEDGRVGVLHCFTGSESLARQVLELGFHISFSGIVTFRNASALRDVARIIPADKLLIETDTPCLAPEPYRGRRNEPSFLPRVAEALAEVRGCTMEEIAELTTRNAERLFGD